MNTPSAGSIISISHFHQVPTNVQRDEKICALHLKAVMTVKLLTCQEQERAGYDPRRQAVVRVIGAALCLSLDQPAVGQGQAGLDQTGHPR